MTTRDGPESPPIPVTSMAGLYDETCVGELHDINARRRCVLAHHWINASLRWSPDERWMIMLRCEGHDGPCGNAPWGRWVRFCKHCKTIDCIHLWGERRHYAIAQSPYYAVHYVVERCRICARTVLTSSWGHAEPSARASALIDDVARELHRPVVSGGQYGSGWLIELPVAVSSILDTQGEEAARAYVHERFRAGSAA